MLRVTPVVSELTKVDKNRYSKPWVDITVVEQDNLLPMDLWTDEDQSLNLLMGLNKINESKPYQILTTPDDVIRGIQKLPINDNNLLLVDIKVKRNLGIVISYRITVEFIDTENVYEDKTGTNYITSLIMQTVKVSSKDRLIYNNHIGVEYFTMLEVKDE